ncbi:MAG: hypothetical protein A2036_02090 [Omnitrophica bacterium GWA2_50_21]|nr:MAG: hypothetical protein A2036_02090 [Omnitrophica bacterium GWA2_50_21]
MGKNLKLEQVLIFIASPSDVSPARECIRRAIDRINRLLAKQAGYLFEAIGWEDIRSGKGERAQEIINHYVDAAHIFIGVLHQRFGSPTGLADSGTEEEFLRIEARWNKEPLKPEIWMYFKKVSPDRLDDPGPQLSKVLEFKKVSSPPFFITSLKMSLPLRKVLKTHSLIGCIHIGEFPYKLLIVDPENWTKNRG